MVTRNTKAMMDYSSQLAQQNMEMFRRSWSAFGIPATATATAAAASDTEAGESETPASRDSELEQIQKQIDALQERLKTLK